MSCYFPLQVPDYYEVVTTPIDLQIIRERVQKREYENARGFLNDLALMLDNCELYNQVRYQQKI